MANVPIPSLPVAISIDGTEQVEIVQPAGSGGTSKRTTTGDIATLASTFILPIDAGDVDYTSSGTGAVERTVAGRLNDWLNVKDFGATGGGGINDRPAFVLASAAGATVVPPGTYLISTSITLAGDWYIAEGATLTPASGQVITFSGDVVAAANNRCFAGAGTVLLNGQRSPVYAEWWGASADGLTASATANVAAFAAMVAACVNRGALWRPANGRYYVDGTTTINNRIDAEGQGIGHNPDVGGTTFSPTTAFAHSGDTMFEFTTGSVSWSRFMILGATTDPTQDYTAIKFAAGSGKMLLEDVEINGAGVGLDLEAGNVGDIINVNIYNCTTPQKSGGTATASGPWDFWGGIFNNANITTVTNNSTASGNDTLHFADASGFQVGMGVAGFNIPIGTTVLAADATTVTMSANATGSGVANGATIRYGFHLDSTLIHILGNSADIVYHGTEIAGGTYQIHIEGTAGLPVPNAIKLESGFNTTASTYYGLVVRRGIAIEINNSRIGDVPFGRVVYASGLDALGADDATAIDTISFSNALIGGGGLDGGYFDYVTNVLIDGSTFAGNGLSAANTYDGIVGTANAVGTFQHTASRNTNSEVFDLVGTQRYAINLAAGAFNGGAVNISSNPKLDGQTAAILNAATPASTMIWGNNGASPQVINLNAATTPAPQAGAVIQLVQADGAQTSAELWSYAASPLVRFKRSNTSGVAPSALALNDFFGTVVGQGYHSGGAMSGGQASVNFIAAEAWTGSARGSIGTLNATPIGSTTNTIIVTWGENGISVLKTMRTAPLTVAGLPAAATVGDGARATVTDANAAFTGANIGSAVAAGGANIVPVVTLGGVWVIG
jgi:hypothetical protein